jgi:hypothetical protein
MKRRKPREAVTVTVLPEAEVIEQINRLHGEIEGHCAAVHEHACNALHKAKRVGELLANMKKRQNHGQWSAWLKKNFHASRETARLYVRIWRRWSKIEQALAKEGVNAMTLQDARRLIEQTRKKPPKCDDDVRFVQRRIGQLLEPFSPAERWLVRNHFDAVFEKCMAELRVLADDLHEAHETRDAALSGLDHEDIDELTFEQDDIHQEFKSKVRRLGAKATTEFQRQILDAECPLAGVA